MRIAFIDTVTKLASADKNVWLVTGDLGFSAFESFRDKFPDQFLNVGVAEQNLISVAAGLAMSGKKVFAYSISTFLSMRPFEQIRNDICYQNLPICLVGGGSAFSYSTFGCTHFALEDLGLMRLLPNMAVTAPGDSWEVKALVAAAYHRRGPTYIRLAKKGEPVVHRPSTKIILGKSVKVAEGKAATLLVCGRQLPNALAAAGQLHQERIDCRVLSFHTIKPLDVAAIVKSGQETSGLVTIEEHFLTGGLGSAVAQVLAEQRISVPLISLGISDEFPRGVGSQDYFLKRYQLTPDGIVKAVKLILDIKK